MTFKDDMTSDLSVFYNTDEFAETVTYSGEEITAIVEREPDKEFGYQAVLRVKVSDVTLPAYRTEVVINGETWTVYHDENITWHKTDDGLEWLIPIKKDSRATFKR